MPRVRLDTSLPSAGRFGDLGAPMRRACAISGRERAARDRCMMRRDPVVARLLLAGGGASTPRRPRGRAVVDAHHGGRHRQLRRGVPTVPRHPAATRTTDGDAGGAGDPSFPARQWPRPCRGRRGRGVAGRRVRGRRTPGVVEPGPAHPRLDHHRPVPPPALQPRRGGDQRDARPRRRSDRRGGGCLAADRGDPGGRGRGRSRHPGVPAQGRDR